jgi:phenol 2-monooxygenase
VLLIPRESGYLIRLYVDMGDVDPGARDTFRRTTVDDVIAIAQRVLHPYTLDVHEVVWFSVYEVGQRVADRFDNGDGTRLPRVFIAGDACHTHSAKAGQGMNVSMQDAFNLGWKLAAVLRGCSQPSLLATYTAERQPVAQELIDFDREWSAMMAARPTDNAADDDTASKLEDYFVRQGRYTAGVATRYRPSRLTGAPTYQHLATGLLVGMRFHSAPVIRVADAKPMELGRAATADGRWRLYLFGDDAGTSLSELCHFLEFDDASPIRRYMPADADIDSVIDVRAVVPHCHRDVSVPGLPNLLRPRSGRYGLTDYEKVFAAPLPNGDDIYACRGINRQLGAIVVARPDQYIGHVLPLTAHAELSSYFAAILTPAT